MKFNKMRYMGCVTDMQFKLALMEQYPNRKPNHPDSFARQKINSEKRDLIELAMESVKHEARRYYAT